MIDRVQLSQLYTAYAAELLLYARQWLDQSSAEDVVQESFVKLAAVCALPANPKAWLYRTARNSVVSLFRQKSRRQDRERNAAADELWFQTASESEIDAMTAVSAMKNLPLEQREILVLRIWSQMTLKEISELTGKPASSVFDIYRAALTSLRKAMGVSCQTDQ